MLGKLFKNRIAEYTVYAVIAVAIIILGTAIFWSIEDPRMLSVKNAKTSESIEDGTVFSGIPVRPSETKPGGIIFMRLDYCKLHDTHGEVTARLVGQKFTNNLTWPDDHTRAGCVDIEIPIPLPTDADDDTYFVEFDVIYQVNPLKTRNVILRSDVFKVSNP